MIPALLAAALAAANGEAAWEQAGRPLPRPEAASVRLDPRLPRYVACRGPLSGHASGSAATILPDLFLRWTRAFAARHPAAALHAPPPYGAPQGKLSPRLREFLDGKTDFALVSRGLTEADLLTFRRTHGTDPLVIPVAAGSWRHFGFVDTVVVIVHRGNPVRRLSLAQIDAVFSAERRSGAAEARDWGQLGVAAWRGRAVHPVGGAGWLAEDSARSAIVRERALLGGPWRADLTGSGNEADAALLVAQDPYAIAITGLGHVPEGVRAVAIAKHPTGPFIAPDYASVSGDRYPLSRTVDLLVRRQADGTVPPVVAEFARFVLSRQGQAEVARQGVFLPLRAGQARRSLGLLGPCAARTSPAR